MRTTLESGEWIEHVPVQDLKGKHKRLLDRHTRLALPSGAISEEGRVDMDAVMGAIDMFAFTADKQDALWALLIDKWSYDLPVPDMVAGDVENADSFGELPLEDYEEIGRLLAPHAAKLARRPDPKKLDYIRLKWLVAGKSARLPDGLSWEAYDDILHVIRFGIMPAAGMGREELPLEVYTWLMPVQQAIDRARQEAAK